MRSLSTIQDVVKARLCISCGACAAVSEDESLEMRLCENEGIFLPARVGSHDTRASVEFSVCPGKGLPLDALSRQRFGAKLPTSPELGRYRTLWACHSTDDQILAAASSGGVMTHVACYLLESGLVDGVTVATFVRGTRGPRTLSKIARSRSALLESQGSKYCPTTTNLLIRECTRQGGRYLFLGTPCQVGALYLAIGQDESLAKVFPYSMANFCGGYRDFRYLDGMLSADGMDPASAVQFAFRGGGWPGKMLATSDDGRQVVQDYPDYRSTALVNKQRRCTLCIDGTGLLADFACGDAWLDRFPRGTPGWSIVVARSAFAAETVESMRSKGFLHTEAVSHEEVLRSQRFNLRSKIYRQRKRMRLFGILGIPCPTYDVRLPESTTSYWQEFRVIVLKTMPMLYLKVRFRQTPAGELVARMVRFLRSLGSRRA